MKLRKWTPEDIEVSPVVVDRIGQEYREVILVDEATNRLSILVRPDRFSFLADRLRAAAAELDGRPTCTGTEEDCPCVDAHIENGVCAEIVSDNPPERE